MPQIFVAEICGPKVTRVTKAKDRSAVERFLLGEPLEPNRNWANEHVPPPADGETVHVGMDFAFGFPASLRLKGDRAWTWDDLANWCREADSADRLEDFINTDRTRSHFRLSGRDPADQLLFRETEDVASASRPRSVFDLHGQGQVGRGSIRGIAMLRVLRDRGVRVWPFDEVGPAGTITVAEVFPTLALTEVGAKTEAPTRIRQIRTWEQSLGLRFEEHARDLTIGSDDALDAVAAAITATKLVSSSRGTLPRAAIDREGWILGVDPQK